MSVNTPSRFMGGLVWRSIGCATTKLNVVGLFGYFAVAAVNQEGYGRCNEQG
jgi:hypothetical protein